MDLSFSSFLKWSTKGIHLWIYTLLVLWSVRSCTIFCSLVVRDTPLCESIPCGPDGLQIWQIWGDQLRWQGLKKALRQGRTQKSMWKKHASVMTCQSFFGPRWKQKPFILLNVPLSRNLAEVLFLISKVSSPKRSIERKNSEAGTVCYGQVGTWKKWKKSVKKGPSHPFFWSSWICTGRPVSLLKSWLFLAVAACWNKKKGRDIAFPASDGGSTGETPPWGFGDGFSTPKKGGSPKMDLKVKKLCGNGSWSWKKDKFIRNQKATPIFFLSQNPHLVGVPEPTTPLGRPGPRGKGATFLRRSQ